MYSWKERHVPRVALLVGPVGTVILRLCDVEQRHHPKALMWPHIYRERGTIAVFPSVDTLGLRCIPTIRRELWRAAVFTGACICFWKRRQ